MSIVAPLPLKSRNAPRSGVSIIAPMGNHAKRSEASWLEMASVFCSMGTANFWKGKMAE